MKYLHYVQPTGNRQTYSNTNIYIDHPNFSFYFEYLFYEQTISSGDWSELLGTGYPNKFRVGTESNGTKSVYIMFGNTKASYNGTIEGEVYIDRERMQVNWEDVITIQNPASSMGAGYLTIGADNQYSGDALVNGNIKIGKLHITDNDSGNEVACLVPAIDDASSDEVVGFYDETNDVFYPSDGTSPWIAGPEILSIGTDPTSAEVDATGDTINIYVGTENSWVVNPTGGTWWSLSDTGGTGDADITLTVSANTSSSGREDTITFIDTDTTDEVVFSISQNGVRPAGGQPFYFGGTAIYEAYLGTTAITEGYAGEDLVFSTNFEGVQLIPNVLNFNIYHLQKDLKVKSSEPWTMTVPAWISASVLTGDTGETVVSLTATTQTAQTTGSVVVTTANFSGSASVEFGIQAYTEVDYIYQANSYGYTQANHIDTEVPHTASTMTVEIEYYGLGGNSDRMVGYQDGDTGCSGDNYDFRIFGFSNGTFDYMRYRNSSMTVNSGYHHITIGDCYAYDNDNSTYLCQGTVVGSVPSPGCHILVDVSYIKVKAVKIKDGNTVLFDGVAALADGHVGLFDRISGELKYNSNIQMGYDELPTPTGYTFVVDTLLGASEGQYWEFAMGDQQGNFSAIYTSTWDDGNQEADNSVTVSQGFTYNLTTDPNDGTNTLTISGPFDPNEYYDVHFYGTDEVQGSCWSADNWDGVEFTASTITISSNFEGDLDPECECTAQGGTWDGENCNLPEEPSESEE